MSETSGYNVYSVSLVHLIIVHTELNNHKFCLRNIVLSNFVFFVPYCKRNIIHIGISSYIITHGNWKNLKFSEYTLPAGIVFPHNLAQKYTKLLNAVDE